MTNSRNSKRRKGDPPRAGYDDKRYKANRLKLKQTGNHICHVCGQAIDLQLPYPHPLSWSCDHSIPRALLHPDDIRHWHIAYLLEAHLRCNEARGAKPMYPTAHHGIETSIDW